MIARDVEAPLRSLLQGFPVVTITGPRQSGKATVAKAAFVGKPYLSLEDPDVRRVALDDVRAFGGGEETVAWFMKLQAVQPVGG
jgi:predicted AAA+ superfamily ATPase